MGSNVKKLLARARALFEKFEKGKGTKHIDGAIALDREALELCPPGHSKRAAVLTILGDHLHNRYEELGATTDLDEAIALNREALSLRPQGHPEHSESLDNLAESLFARYEQSGVMEDLQEVIVFCREALSLRPKGHPDRSSSLNIVADSLFAQYEQLGAIEDLEESIVLHREALTLLSKRHPDRHNSLNNLAGCLHTRFLQLGAIEDLEEAIALHRAALKFLSKGHPDRWDSLNTLADSLYTRCNELGVIQDLEEAIVLGREALRLLPKGHSGRSPTLDNLANSLSARYDQLGVIQDLEETIVLGREALSLMQKGDPERSITLSNLADSLHSRYDELEVIQDLEEVIVLSREALSLRPKGHPDRPESLNNLADSLLTRYNQLGVIEDLEEAIVLGRESLSFRPKGHPCRWDTLSTLADCLHIRYKQLGVIGDLEEAIVLGLEVLDILPKGHPSRSESLSDLADYLRMRFHRLGRLQDKEDSFGLYTQLTLVHQYVSPADIDAARKWAEVAEEFQHPSLLLAYETTLRLLIRYLATLPSLPQHHVIVKNLTSSLAVDAFSACLRNCVPTLAVEFLEQGRGVFWGQLTRIYSPLQGVVESGLAGKTLADQFTRLALDTRKALNGSNADQHERLWLLNLKMQEVVTDIRKLPGLSRFLLPPLFSDLRHAAAEGPVIILNASKYSCDALIVFLDRDLVHIPLQITRDITRAISAELHRLIVRAKKENMTTHLGRLLREVWDRIVRPIVDVLRPIVPISSRIWWCPTSEFSLLPLHAAGPYRKGEQNLANFYISSYTPTLSALIRSRRRNKSTLDGGERHFLAIGQAKASGESELVSIEGEESCIDKVVEEFDRNEWVHLACHGIPNPARPFESAFALRDGYFTVEHIIRCELKNPEFAYLSACHTTVGDKESPDEAIHLASAMQFAGFRSVIGTMWAVDDGQTNKITSMFYKYMVDDSGRLDYTRAAFALNKTMKSIKIPFDQQILYVHLGA